MIPGPTHRREPMAPCLIIAFVGLLAFFLSTTSARAEAKEDEGLWLMLAAKGDLASISEELRDFRWWLDLQPRFFDRNEGLGQALVRPGIGHALSESVAGWLGYAWILTERNRGGHTQEHRIWQQLTWSPRMTGFDLSSRTRLEQRFLDSGDDAGWRFRQFLKTKVPVTAGSRLFLSIYDEVFVDLNGTDWGQRKGFAQNRFFLGLGWKIGSEEVQGTPSLEVGYLNQFVDRRRVDRMNHILSINLFLTF